MKKNHQPQPPTNSGTKTAKATIAQKEQVQKMFDNIAPSYDLLNHLLSADIDKLWRRRVIKMIRSQPHRHILDLATGTGDLAIAAAALPDTKVTAVDLSAEMLKFQQKKLQKKNLQEQITLLQGDGEALPFDDDTFDVVMIAFGVRNFEDLPKGLAEMRRVLKKDGLVVILEFSKPRTFPVKQLYQFYFKRILPTVGRWISKDKSAYSYLPDSVGYFPSGTDFTRYLTQAGYTNPAIRTLTLGIASIYSARK
ncbi:MAG TPA: bifunctional demethylmenaquinone methyltransferase/2-methoxy-6-polyprenyl-1,4-benzoquinol methylase UbiE [Bacteroidales bacterium]|nr:bifunctional demethylmenaquinone methyltransferase/2-methoxy-6-polyprenyl-1,4-benzoquinol methylase UbiE [Bacteroidales bacterium]